MKIEVECYEGKDDNADKVRSEDGCGHSSKWKGQIRRIEDIRNENRRQIKDTEN